MNVLRTKADKLMTGKPFKSSRDLKNHAYIHTGAKPYSCRHCSDSFTWHRQLKTHLLKSHNESTWFTCHICQKKFSRSDQLKTHLLRHEDVGPYVCSECAKCFYTAYALKRHQPTHSDFKPFCCGLCDKDFKCKENIIKHFK